MRAQRHAAAAGVQTAGPDPLVAGLTRILHGSFTGVIEAHFEGGRIVLWEPTESFKGGRVLREALPPRKEVVWYAGELERLAIDLTGLVRLKCMDGAVIQYERRQSLPAGDLLAE